MSILTLPILLPLVFMVMMLTVRKIQVVSTIAVLGSFVVFMSSILIFSKIVQHDILVLYVGGWEAPYGITLVADYLSGLMLVVASLIAFAIAMYAVFFMKEKLKETRFYVFFFSLLMGVNGSFLTGDVFNLYVWSEVMLMSSFVLISAGKSKEQLEGGIKYMALNLIGSLFFLAGLGLLFGKTGTLNMAHLAEILQNEPNADYMNTSTILFFIAFGIKSAIFPLFFWLPASYHTPDITITSLFAGLLTKVGVYALIRFFTLFFCQDPEFWHKLLLILAGFTMVIGGMAASTHYDTRKILSYHIISQIGYMIMGLGIHTKLGIAGAIFFMLHNMIAKTNIFLISGVIQKIKGNFDLKTIGGLLKSNPFLAVLFFIPAFALAGIPPLSGFFGKFILIKAGIDNGNYVITILAVLTAMLTLYSMVKLWLEAFLKKQPEPFIPEKKKIPVVAYTPIVLLALASVLLGLFANTFVEFSLQAASQLLDPQLYIHKVLHVRL